MFPEATRKTDNQIQYSKKLDKLFDINHAASENVITISEDKQFLQLQRESRSGVIGPVDMNKAKREKRKWERQCKDNECVEREKQRINCIRESEEKTKFRRRRHRTS